MALDRRLGETRTERSLVDLVRLRMAQLDGCDASWEVWSRSFLAGGGDAGRLRSLADWRRADLYSDRERAALEWAEALAREEGPVPDEAFASARATLSERELCELTLAVQLAHAWNRTLLALGSPAATAEAGPSPDQAITWTTEETDVAY